MTQLVGDGNGPVNEEIPRHQTGNNAFFGVGVVKIYVDAIDFMFVDCLFDGLSCCYIEIISTVMHLGDVFNFAELLEGIVYVIIRYL